MTPVLGLAKMRHDLIEVIGFRGEKVVELCLTNYQSFSSPLFRPGFLGDKWPSIDFYVELLAVRGKKPYFFCQAKATKSRLLTSSRKLRISTKRQDIVRLMRIPGPTYIFGIHEPSRRVFVRAVHGKTKQRAITTIPLTHELTPTNLRALHSEVRRFWEGSDYK